MTAQPTPQVAAAPATRPRSRVRIMLAMLATVVLGSAWVAVAGNAQAAVPTPAGWKQVFADDFTGAANSRINTANWRYDTGTGYPGGPQNGFGTSEVETMTDSTANVALDGNGNLRITALRGGPTGWTSGRIETNRTDFQPPAGGKLRVEARLKLPQVSDLAGYWPAFWMLGAPYRGVWWNWPSVGEIDIMENVNGLNREWGTFHCGTSPGGPCNEKSGIGANVPCAGTTCQGGFHTYAIEWDKSTNPQQIRWYLDGKQFHAVTSAQFDAGTWNAATNHGFFIILNVAIGGEFPAALGAGPTGSSGGSMLVDYVAAWTAGAGGPPPGGGTPPPPVSPPPTCGPLISQGRPTASSAIEAPNLAAQYAVDGNPNTRWSSAFSDPQWMRIDLGKATPVTRVRLNWEAAYATGYTIQLSTDGTTWTDAYTQFGGDGGIDDLNVKGTARYVRMYGTTRATGYGYSLWEFEVYGACGSTPPPGGGTPPPAGNRDAYAQIPAGSHNDQSGLSPLTVNEGGQGVTGATNGDWALYKGVNFGGTAAHQFVARVASGATGGVSGLVEVRLDSRTSAPIGSFAIANTGGWQSWRTVPANISGVTGTHDVYLTFTSGQPTDYVNVNWFTFGH